jgi:putative ABC transport system permease protein
MTVLVPLAALFAVLVGLMAWDLARGRGLRRLALRNIARRPAEALLVVVGAALGTAIITSALVVGDTFDATIRDLGRTELGPVDEHVFVEDAADLDRVVAAVDPATVPTTDGALTTVGATAAVVAPEAENAGGDDDDPAPGAEPRAFVGELDFDAGRAFGGDPASTGLAGAGPTPDAGEAVVNRRLADDVGLGVGDPVEVHAYGRTLDLTVRTVVPRVGLAGGADLFVAPGTLAGLASSSGAGEPPVGILLVSNTGGVFDGAHHSDAVADALEARLTGIDGVEVATVKQDVLDDAEAAGAEMRSLFASLGTFSALVGVLLLVNLFVMLAEERKSELGVMRAVGLKRNHLVRLFGLEGGIYSLAAAVTGVALGAVVGRAIIAVTRSIIADGDLTFVFAAEPASLVTGGLVGLAISLVTVWATSARIARLNVIRAIRDLPDPPADRLSVRRAVLASLGVAAGLLLTQAGVAGDEPAPALVGPPVALFSAVPLVARLLPRRLVVSGAALGAGAWAVAATTAVPDAFEDQGFEIFLVQGLVLVSAGIALATQADRAWAWLADRLADRGGLSARLALAYPLARRGRTGILLAMFSLVVFTLTATAVVNASDQARTPQLTAQASGGWDVWVDSSPTGPLAGREIATTEGVAQVSPLLVGHADLATGGEHGEHETHEDEAMGWPVTGFESSLLDRGVPELAERDVRFADDRAAFEAVAADPDLAIASEDLLVDDGAAGDAAVAVGDLVTLIDPATGGVREVTVAGVTDQDWMGNGLLSSRALVHDLLGERATESRHYVAVDPGADAEAVADRIVAAFVANGADARTFRGAVEEDMREGQGFMRLMQGYLALGLVIGIAGLGVVMVRAGRERRRQVGVLRAMGFSARVVRRAFLLEAGFVAVQGVAIGLSLGLVTTKQMLATDALDVAMPFRVPWVELAVLVVVPALAALASAVVPAAQAARIRPAAALRVAE